MQLFHDNVAKFFPSRYQTILLVSFCLFVGHASSRSQAAIVIRVQDAMINAGSSGTVDVLIWGTNSDLLQLYNYVFQITNVGAPSSALELSDPQDYSDSALSNYLFFNDSVGIDDTTLDPDLIEAGDFTNSGNDVTLPSSTTPSLLARLDIQHLLGPGQTAIQTAGEQFRIALVSDAGTFFENTGGEINQNNSAQFDSANFTTFGTITVSATSVPEPQSIGLMGLLTGTLWIRLRRRQK